MAGSMKDIKLRIKSVESTMQKIDADGKLEPDRVDAILNAWKAYAGGNDHVVQ